MDGCRSATAVGGMPTQAYAPPQQVSLICTITQRFAAHNGLI
jgi:hypothetical protein